LTRAGFSNRPSHSKGAAFRLKQKMHVASMVGIPLKQSKQVTFRGNLIFHFDEVGYVISLHVNIQKKIQKMSAYPSDKIPYFLQEGTGCKKKTKYMA